MPSAKRRTELWLHGLANFFQSHGAEASALAAVVQAISSVSVLIVTAWLAIITRQYAEAAKRQASAEIEQARSSNQQASASVATLEHLRTERDLEWRPYLVWNHEYPNPEISNLGRGPALNCRALRLTRNADGPLYWEVTQRLDLAPGQRIRVSGFPTSVRDDQAPPELADQVVTICQDQIGRAYWFRPDFPQPIIWGVEKSDSYAYTPKRLTLELLGLDH